MRKLAVIDTETDPFKHLRIPRPFCVEFYSDDLCFSEWGGDAIDSERCIERFAKRLEALKDEYVIYAHNGGKFDFHFFHPYLENPIKVINSRIVQANIFHHIFRDSFAILPVPLRDYEKDEFDYKKMERGKRERHKEQILRYLHSDCVNLFNLVSAFREQFGDKLTIASTAIKEIAARHPFRRQNIAHDKIFRRWYFGGRVQCWENGIIKGPWKLIDVNSSYPFTMTKQHPVNGSFRTTSKMPSHFDKPFFLRFEGRNRGALPVKREDGGLDFEQQSGEFFACSHEIEVALRYGLIDIKRVLECHVATETQDMAEFVYHFNNGKIAAKRAGDQAGYLFNKLISNSGYGKYGQNPEHFRDWVISRDPGDELTLIENGYEMQAEFEDFDLWSRPSEMDERALFDVSIAASITSGSRALLLEAKQHADRPVYCDTDSLICRDFHGDMDDMRLGAWKLEKEAQFAAIAGKKLYALYDQEACCGFKSRDCEKAHKCLKAVKLASKGGNLTLNDLLEICRGKQVVYEQAAPSFSIRRKEVKFPQRRFSLTVDRDEVF